MSVDFELYKIFYYVAESANITKAASELCMTQPGVTKDIHNLENQLGCQLFIRSRKGVKLTADGAVLFQQIQPACKAILAAENTLTQRNLMEKGSLHIGCNDLVVKIVLLPAIKKFREIYPNITISISRTPPAYLSEALNNHDLDMAIEFNMDTETNEVESENNGISIVNVSAMNSHEINTQIIGHYFDVPIVGPSLAFLSKTELSISDLFDFPLIIPSQDTVAKNYYTKLFKDHGLSRGIDIEASGPDRRLMLTENNMGISFTPKELVQDKIREKKLFPLNLNEKLMERELILVTNRSKSLTNAAKEFIKLL